MRIISIIALLALAGCGQDDDVLAVTKDMKVCRDGGGRPTGQDAAMQQAS